jgi:hypothetical protein
MLIELLILIVVLGLISYVARALLGEPFATYAHVVCVIILIAWLIRLIRPWAWAG